MIFRLIVISRMDAATLWAGDVARPAKPRITYQNHSQQIEESVEPNGFRALNMASHMDTLQHAMDRAEELQGQGVLPPKPR